MKQRDSAAWTGERSVPRITVVLPLLLPMLVPVIENNTQYRYESCLAVDPSVSMAVPSTEDTENIQKDILQVFPQVLPKIWWRKSSVPPLRKEWIIQGLYQVQDSYRPDGKVGVASWIMTWRCQMISPLEMTTKEHYWISEDVGLDDKSF